MRMLNVENQSAQFKAIVEWIFFDWSVSTHNLAIHPQPCHLFNWKRTLNPVDFSPSTDSPRPSPLCPFPASIFGSSSDLETDIKRGPSRLRCTSGPSCGIWQVLRRTTYHFPDHPLLCAQLALLRHPLASKVLSPGIRSSPSTRLLDDCFYARPPPI